jgi:AAA+ ATPase superfamily predicted ATPase
MSVLTKSFRRLPIGGGCISSTLSGRCAARYNTKISNECFNRKHEFVNFTNAFSQGTIPEIHVVLGPPSSGKTALIREITTKGNFSPLFIDGRYGHLYSPTRLYDSIFMQFKSFFNKQEKFLNEILKTEIKEKIPYFSSLEIRLFSEKQKEKITSSGDVCMFLSEITHDLPTYNSWNFYNIPPPILIIDEVNMLTSQIGSSKEGEFFLKSFLNWLVSNTMEEKRFHVVLTTSDSLFLDWIVGRKSSCNHIW